jgi:SOS-response transcriptional repressor LexA
MAAAASNSLYARLISIKPADLTLNAWTIRAGVSRNFFNDVRRRGNANHESLEKVLDAIGVSWAQFDADRLPLGVEGAGTDSGVDTLVRSEVKGTGMQAHDVERAWRGPQPQKPVPLLGTAFGGEWSDGVEMTELHLTDVLDYVGRPQAVAGDPGAYAVEIVGDSMEPRYEPGERAIVSPRAQVRPGDDVIVQLKSEVSAAPSGEEVDGRIPDPDHVNRVTLVLIKRLVRQTPSFLELQQFNPPETFHVPRGRVAAIHRVMTRF